MKAFLAAPFSSKYDKKEKKFDVLLKDLIISIIKVLEKNGFEVFSSHMVEEWGSKLATPDEYLPRDIEELKKSDIMIALINGNTHGVYVELGWGHLFGKRTIALVKVDMEIPEFIHGILEVNKTKIVRFNSNNELMAKLLKYLTEIMEERQPLD